MRHFKARVWCLAMLFLISYCAVGCRQSGFSLHEADTLDSLHQVDDWPLYVMHYRGAYAQAVVPDAGAALAAETEAPWACSLFAALGDPANMVYGRSFDWEHSPAVLLFTAPPDGYASVSMVDIAYLGFAGQRAQGLDEQSLGERAPLLQAPYLPFDGMNERGLAIGMAAVAPGNVPIDPDKETIGSLAVMREVLDRAADVDEALAILDHYNIDYGGGPALHYLIADRSGRAILVEYDQGERIVHDNERPWHLATNFIVSSVETPQGQCARYDTLERRLSEAQGALTSEQAMEGLSDVAQANTQWSITYNLNSGQVQVVMGRNYEQVHTFKLKVE